MYYMKVLKLNENALTVHGLSTIHGPNINWYATIAKCKNVLNMVYINHKKKDLLQDKLRL